MNCIRLPMLCYLCVLFLAACGGGGSGNPAVQPAMPQQWQGITSPNPGYGLGTLAFTSCGVGIVAQLEPSPIIPSAAVSIDHGSTWQPSPLKGAIQELDNGSHYWTYPGFMYPAPFAETDDCGTTWIAHNSLDQLDLCLGAPYPDALWRGGESGMTLFVQGGASVTQLSICSSTDGGQTWQPGPVSPAIIHAVRGSHWFAIFNDASPPGVTPLAHLLRSDDEGQTWQATGLQSANLGLTIIAMTALGPAMYVIAANPSVEPGTPNVETLWRWNDGTATWAAAPPFPWTLPNLVSYPGITLAVNPAASSQLFLSFDQRVFESQDAGNTWVDVSLGLPAISDSWSLLFDPSLANRLYAVSGVQPPPSGMELYFALDLAP